MAALTKLFHPVLGTEVEVAAGRAKVLEARGYTRTAPEPATEDEIERGQSALVGGVSAEDLKGEALDAALKEAGLSLEGKADEKRARIAEYRALSEQSNLL